MFGTKYARMVSGRWHHVGYLMTSGLPVSLSVRVADAASNGSNSSDKIIPKYTLVVPQVTNEFSMVLSSGYAMGVLTQDVSAEGLLGGTGFKNIVIGKYDNPVKQGGYVSIRTPALKTQWEIEGLGDAVPGNLLRTTGGPAIDGATTFMKALTSINGCLQEATTGDVIVAYFHRLLTPLVDSGNTRALVEWAGGNHVL